MNTTLDPGIKTVEQISSDESILKIKDEVPTIIERATRFRIVSNESLEEGAQISAWIRKAINTVDERRKFFVGPLNDHVKRINALFKVLTSPLETSDKILCDKMYEWREKERNRIAAEQAKLQKKAEKLAEKKGVPVESIPVPRVAQAPRAVGAGTFKIIWTYKLRDGETLKIPQAFWTVDESKIKEAIDGGVREIPGIDIFQKEVFSRR